MLTFQIPQHTPTVFPSPIAVSAFRSAHIHTQKTRTHIHIALVGCICVRACIFSVCMFIYTWCTRVHSGWYVCWWRAFFALSRSAVCSRTSGFVPFIAAQSFSAWFFNCTSTLERWHEPHTANELYGISPERETASFRRRRRRSRGCRHSEQAKLDECTHKLNNTLFDVVRRSGRRRNAWNMTQ